VANNVLSFWPTIGVALLGLLKMDEHIMVHVASAFRRSTLHVQKYWAVVTPLLLCAAWSAPALAQCRPPNNSNEARLLAFYEAPIVFSMADAPERLAPGAVRVGVEGAPIPTPNAALQHTHLCYQSTTQSTRLAPAFGRPRVTVGLPAGFAAEASYLPPVSIAGAQPNIGSIALSRAQSLPLTGGRATLLLRAHGTIGRVRGAITCPRSGLQTQDPAQPCYGSEPSRDSFDPNMFGAEGAISVRAPSGRIALYVGGGATWLRPRFQVGFTDATGIADATRVAVNLVRGTLFGGLTARVTNALDLSGQLYAVPTDVTTFRLGIGYRLR
jgi:hypothetical protein